MSKYFLDSDEAITGVFGGEFNNDKGAFGNATLKLLARSKGMKKWKFVMQQDFIPVSYIYFFLIFDIEIQQRPIRSS